MSKKQLAFWTIALALVVAGARWWVGRGVDWKGKLREQGAIVGAVSAGSGEVKFEKGECEPNLDPRPGDVKIDCSETHGLAGSSAVTYGNCSPVVTGGNGNVVVIGGEGCK